MGLDNFIETAMNKVLKNPIIEVLRDINFASILKQSNFKKRDIGVKPYMIILQFLYMCKKRMNLATNNGNTWSDKTVLFGH